MCKCGHRGHTLPQYASPSESMKAAEDLFREKKKNYNITRWEITPTGVGTFSPAMGLFFVPKYELWVHIAYESCVVNIIISNTHTVVISVSSCAAFPLALWARRQVDNHRGARRKSRRRSDIRTFFPHNVWKTRMLWATGLYGLYFWV